MFKSQSKPLSTTEIFNAYNTHKEEFLILDIFPETDNDKKDKLRSNTANSVQYGDVLIKKDNGTIVPLCLKMIQLSTLGRIKEPKERDYETLKLSFRLNDKENPESEFGRAMDLICKTFEQKVNQYTADGKIAVKPKARSGSLKVHSVNPTFPIQYEVENKETGQVEELDNPIMWFELKTKYYKSDEIEKLQQFDNLYYRKDGKPIMMKDFSARVCDLSKKIDEEVIRVDPKTGNKTRKMTSQIPIAVDDNDNTLNNCNIQSFITPGSALSGFLEVQLTISGRAFNLKTTFKSGSNLYVYPNTSFDSNKTLELDTDEVDEMIPQNLVKKNMESVKKTNTVSEGLGSLSLNTTANDEDSDDDELTAQLNSIPDE